MFCRYFAVTFGRGVQIWNTPGIMREFGALNLIKDIQGGYDDACCLNWSCDSR